MPISEEIKRVINQGFLKVLYWFKVFTIIIVSLFILVNLIMFIFPELREMKILVDVVKGVKNV